MSAARRRSFFVAAIVLLSLGGALWWRTGSDATSRTEESALAAAPEEGFVEPPLRSEDRASTPTADVPRANLATAAVDATSSTDATEREAPPAPGVFLYGRIDVTASGLVAPPQAVELRFVDATGRPRTATLHDGARYTCSEVAPGAGVATVELSSSASMEIEFEAPCGVAEHRLDLQVSAPYHVALPVFVNTPDGRRFEDALQNSRIGWNPATGLAHLGMWVAASESALPERLALESTALRASFGIGRWTSHMHVGPLARDEDGTLEVLRWAPTTYVALYRDDERLATTQFQHPPERIELTLDPTPLQQLAAATLVLRCLDAQDLAPLAMIQIEIGGTNGSRFLPLVEGRGRIEGLLPGARSIAMVPFGRVPRSLELELASGEERDLGDLLFERGRSLRLRVLDEEGQPLQGSVQFVPADAGPSTEVRTSRLDAEGAIELAGLAPTLQRCTVWRGEGQNEQRWQSLVDLSASEPLQLELRWPAEWHTLVLDIRLDPWEEAWREFLDGEGRSRGKALVTGSRKQELRLPTGSYRVVLRSLEGVLLDEASIELPSAVPSVRLQRRAR